MCEICGSMLAAEHTERPGAELCPKCRRFPLDAEEGRGVSGITYIHTG
jgi:Zn-finger nucleic acid-binding protein